MGTRGGGLSGLPEGDAWGAAGGTGGRAQLRAAPGGSAARTVSSLGIVTHASRVIVVLLSALCSGGVLPAKGEDVKRDEGRLIR
jgi:hypothetical protein